MRRRYFTSEGGQKWFIRFHSETHDESGKKRSWTRYAPGPVIVKEYLPTILPYRFFGCPVTVTTPIHSDSYIVDPDTKQVQRA